MFKMLDYANNKVICNGCPSCAFANHEFSIDSGMAYEDDMFTLAQDWELPIDGFIILMPKRHIENFEEFTEQERIKAFDIINKTIKILRKNDVCDRFNVIFEEKKDRHFHIWIMPRHQWLADAIGSKLTGNISKLFDFAKGNLKTPQQFEKINKVIEILRNEFQKN